MGLRLGILGGTFDPIHLGHLVIAQEAAVTLALDRVLFLPAGRQPLKQGQAITPSPARVAMIEAAIGDNPTFMLSRADLNPPGLSYTVDTLDRLRAEWGSTAQFWFIIGEDALANLLAWRDPAGILARTRLAVAPRPGVIVPWPTLDLALPQLRATLDTIPIPPLAVSATDLRARIAAGRPIRYLVPDRVAAYIREQGLYQVVEP